MNTFLKIAAVALSLPLAACRSYTWTSRVPSEMRTVAVPTFRNESDVTELGSLVTRQVLREFQREGTFRQVPSDRAAIEIQGVIKSKSRRVAAVELRSDRYREHAFSVRALVSFIDKRNGRVLVDNRPYTARTTFLVSHDALTGERDASGRLAEDLARQIVDDALSFNWQRSEP